MEEQTLLQAEERLVTTTRIVVSGQTFAVRNITAVKMVSGKFSLWHVLGIAVGIALASIDASMHYGLPLIFLVAFMGWKSSRVRTIFLSTSGGEVQVWKSSDDKAAHAFSAAIADAIAQR